jgi:hypothetical protein
MIFSLPFRSEEKKSQHLLTLIVCEILQTIFSEYSTQWTLIVMKSHQWVLRENNGDQAVVEELKIIAQKFVHLQRGNFIF